MCTTIIHGVPVALDYSLSQEQIYELVSELKQTWTWEGREIARVEISRAGHMIHVRTYEKPIIKIIPVNKLKELKERDNETA